ncbi:hypothetical protein AK812_SmicGene45069 [Symbiodinium microadriaticum]|uniref:Uncharacterized protein n=1 Tax=Symbiodinium microadriaticum TaxID=2951 RepID=A0A1Q9BWY2_SYMMI|nr:hypothetical protein AK812_SmicGene45069 [Symbiodinium microadriaticum]
MVCSSRQYRFTGCPMPPPCRTGAAEVRLSLSFSGQEGHRGIHCLKCGARLVIPIVCRVQVRVAAECR